VLRLRSSQDLVAGLCTILVAALALWEIRDLRTGTIFRMGPGYIPLVLASIVAGLGTIITASAFALHGARLERWGWRSIVIVGAAILFFAVAIESLGLFVTTAVLTLGASFAEPHNRFASALAFALAYAAFVVLVFPLALRVGVPAWPRL
jgi:putative tricarboxylic transport membrane protein